MKNVRVILAPVDGDIGRTDLEHIEGMSFDSIDDVGIELGSPNFEHYTLSDFMDSCNDTDDDATYITLMGYWVGYISLNN